MCVTHATVWRYGLLVEFIICIHEQDPPPHVLLVLLPWRGNYVYSCIYPVPQDQSHMVHPAGMKDIFAQHIFQVIYDSN